MAMAKRRKAGRRAAQSRSRRRDDGEQAMAAAAATRGGPPSLEVITVAPAAPSPSPSPAEGEQRNKLIFADGKQPFELDDLLQASAEVLGKGALGTSYKAVLENGLIVSVKRLHDVEEGRGEEYRNGLMAIGRVRHSNVVPLRAFYVGKDENLLVYDFMQNGSLSSLLHGSRSAGINQLDWDTRLRVAATTAAGLAAIHAHNIVHGNIKSSNVLLKSNLEGCVTDYGISPLMLSTAVPPKSVGYAAPELRDPRKISPQSDVFGYGVLLLELLTGKVPLVPSLPAAFPSSSSASGGGGDGEPVDVPLWVQSAAREARMTEVLDPFLVHSGQTSNEEEMVHLLQIALACVSPSPDQRPDMATVVRQINSIHPSTDEDKSSDLSPRQYQARTSEQASSVQAP